MEHLNKATSQIRYRIWLISTLLQLIAGAICYGLYSSQIVKGFGVVILFVVLVLVTAFITARVAAYMARLPLEAIGKAILHISPSMNTASPQTDNLEVGREYVTTLIYQLYQVASLQDNKILAEHKREATQASNILSRLPLPLLVFNKEQIITFGSDAALNYLGLKSPQIFGRPIYEAIDLEFPTEFTLESWVNDCQKNKVTDTAYWSRVRIKLSDDNKTVRQCDMSGYFNRDNPTGIEFIVTLFDRTAEYAQDDRAVSFTALAVHELRTPLTLMRGYIEVFEDELGDKLDAELTEFMHRMHGAAQQLSSFVNNILNVAKIEENQLTLKLAEDDWIEILKHAVGDMEQRAKSLGKKINISATPDLPKVAIDKVTIYEVIVNLLDNAIKYSGTSAEINVKTSITQDGLIETIVQDFGVGIPSSVLPNLFEKFHRNHRNQSQISGTGLGLFLSKAIVNAHGGDIWVKSKEGEGTTVGFTLKPYTLLADELKTGNNKDDMVRTAHGWIKNHSLYRR